MGVEPFFIALTLVGVLAQRFICRVCKNCQEFYDPEDLELQLLGITREDIQGKQFSRGRGCEMCNNTGYKGRVGIFELLSISQEIQLLINERKPTQLIKECAVKQGMITMRADGINQILNGVSSAEEVLQYTVF
jgi:type IV pilus assembly protein PilB